MRFVTLVCAGLLLAAPLFPSAVAKNRKGNKEYKKGQYDPAVSLYRDAEVENPEEKAFSYNLGNALYRKGDYETAAKSYERAFSSKDKALRARAYFNAGNNFYREAAKAQEGGQEKLDDAVKMYKEVLKIDPSDQAAKFNLQKTLERIEQLEQQQDKKQDEQDKKQDKKNQDGQDKKEQQKQEQDKKKEEEQKQKEQQADKDKDKKEEKKEQQAGKPGQMTPEEAKQLLEAVKQDEKELQKKRLERMMGTRRLEKDW